jgi:homoserine O-succinyltransferase/O-acetyltransferase
MGGAMTLLFDKHPPTLSPALAPFVDDIGQESAVRSELAIALINNMPDASLKATERQFQRLIEAASGRICVRFHCFSLPSITRSGLARRHVESEYRDIAELAGLRVAGMIVTGAEPIAGALDREPYWKDLTALIDWAKVNTRSTIWSCLAAHAAVQHLDGIARRRLDGKCSGVYDCASIGYDWMTNGAPQTLKIAHSRDNELKERELVAHGYQILTRSEQAGVDIFIKQYQSRFILFQGHPEYDAQSLQREYMRDIARFLSRERQDYPVIPENYFDAATESTLRAFEVRAKVTREPTLAAELPGLTLRPDLAAGIAATVLFRNWIGYLKRGAAAALCGPSEPAQRLQAP